VNPWSFLSGKIYEINWLLPALIYLLGFIGVAAIYAATDGVWNHGAQQHLIRLILAGGVMVFIALIDIRVWYHLAYPLYAVGVALLGLVHFFGVAKNGSQRWLDIGVTDIQPSELMKVAIVLALARYYHDLDKDRVSHVLGMFIALTIIALPAALVLLQPDLGTTLLITASALAIVFLSGINWRVIGAGVLTAGVAIPLFVLFGLKEYQRKRIMTFFDPSVDPTGAGYHITQSKIALGSGGVSGKGYMQGTQRQLEYVPENRTDFIFTIIGEEFGLIGGLATMGLYILLLGLCIWMAMQCRHKFSQLMVLGLTATFALYVFINLAMVMGLAPVVGVPLPLISYGGTVILTVMSGFGLILSAHLYRQSELPRGGR